LRFLNISAADAGRNRGVFQQAAKAYAEETDIHDGSSVDLSLHDGNLVITPVRRKTFSLDELLDGITAENRHDVADTGSALGQEIW
jgi:antitoxin MazE